MRQRTGYRPICRAVRKSGARTSVRPRLSARRRNLDNLPGAAGQTTPRQDIVMRAQAAPGALRVYDVADCAAGHVVRVEAAKQLHLAARPIGTGPCLDRAERVSFVKVKFGGGSMHALESGLRETRKLERGVVVPELGDRRRGGRDQ